MSIIIIEMFHIQTHQVTIIHYYSIIQLLTFICEKCCHLSSLWCARFFARLCFLFQCYKCARDLLPHLQLSLRGCQLVYKLKSNRKIPHQLKLLLLGADTLVLGYSSFQQADEWRRVSARAWKRSTHAHKSRDTKCLHVLDRGASFEKQTKKKTQHFSCINTHALIGK